MIPVHTEMSIKELVDTYPQTLPVFQSFGFHDFDKPQVREKLGPFVKVKTLLKHKSISEEVFLERCRAAVSEKDGLEEAVDIKTARPTLLALLPCGLKVSLDKALQEFVAQTVVSGEPLAYLAEGNVNHELSYYPYVDSVEAIEELPDLILSSDINAFYHHRFLERFVLPGHYESVNLGMNSRFTEIGYNDPRGFFTMFCANTLVLVHVKDTDSACKPPRSWQELLAPEYQKSIVMRGQESFFCSGVLVPFFRLYGIEAISSLAGNVCAGVHPSQMVKMIDTGGKEIAPFYIMPRFFAQKIKNKGRIEIIYPEEGAFISPVQLLVKREKKEKLAKVIDFLMGEALHQHCSDNFFPSPHPEVSLSLTAEQKMFWLGWDFIYANDLEQIKREVGELFTAEFLRTNEGQCS